MTVKRKTIRRTPWKRVLERTQVFFDADNSGLVCSLLRFDRLTSPLFRDYGDGRKAPIAAEGGYWLQLARDGDNFWYTSFFDRDDRFRQVYIDITGGNDCKNPEKAFFDDLFLDIVYTSDNRIYVLDRDELDAAKNERVITVGQYENVLSLADIKLAQLRSDGPALAGEMEKYFAVGKNMMK